MTIDTATTATVNEDPTGPFDDADPLGQEPGATHDPTLPDEQMFSARQAPWMKLGKLVSEPVTAAEAAKLGGLDFKVVECPVYFKDEEAAAKKQAAYTKIEGRKALVREDTGAWLGLVSKAYPVVQFGEAFDFMDAVSPHFIAAGVLRGGKQGFMVVKTQAEINIADDPTQLFAVLRTSHDCSRAVEVMVMPLRDRCMNQLTLRSFSKNVPHRWAIVHAGDVKSKLAAAHESLAHLSDYASAYEANVKRLVDVKVTDEFARETLTRALPDRPKRGEVIETIITGWHHRPDTVGYEGRGWGLVNAVSEYFEWDRRGGSPESRFLAALQGQTHNAINKVTAAILSRA